jgi:hypothetical protein
MDTGFWWESQKEKDHWEDLDVRWEDNTKIEFREIGWSGMDWIDLAEDRNKWLAVVNTAVHLGVP